MYPSSHRVQTVWSRKSQCFFSHSLTLKNKILQNSGVYSLWGNPLEGLYVPSHSHHRQTRPGGAAQSNLRPEEEDVQIHLNLSPKYNSKYFGNSAIHTKNSFWTDTQIIHHPSFSKNFGRFWLNWVTFKRVVEISATRSAHRNWQNPQNTAGRDPEEFPVWKGTW